MIGAILVVLALLGVVVTRLIWLRRREMRLVRRDRMRRWDHYLVSGLSPRRWGQR